MAAVEHLSEGLSSVAAWLSALQAAAPPAASDGRGVIYAVPGGWFEATMFIVFAGTAVVSALGVCLSRSVVRMATWLFFALGAVAILYFLLAATFLAAIQLIVYVGGVLILLIFGVMLTNQSPWIRMEPTRTNVIIAGVICLGLLICLATILSQGSFPASAPVTAGSTIEALGRRLLTQYVVPFEVAGVLLMIVMVGAAHLARQEKQ